MRNNKTLSFFYILVLTFILISVGFLSTQSTTIISKDDVTTTDVFGTNATFTGLIKSGNLSMLEFDWDNLYNVPPLGGGGGNPFDQWLNTTDLVLFDTVNVSGIANIVAGEGLNAELNLWADEGDDSQDKWRIEADGAGLHFEDVYSSRYASIQYNTGVVINEGGDDDVDFRVESDTETHALFVDAEYGNVSCGTFFVDAINDYVGIGTITPGYELDVLGNIGFNSYLYHRGDDNTNLQVYDDNLRLRAGGEIMIALHEEATQDTLKFGDGGNIDVSVNTGGISEALFIHGLDGNVGVGTDVPAYELDVNGDVNISGVLYTDNVSNKYMFNEDYDANANKFEVISPNGNKIVHIGIDQLWNIAQLYTDSNALEVWAAGFKQLTISNTVADFDNNNIVTTGNVNIGNILHLTPLALAPGAPVEGDIYYNSVNHKAYCYDGTVWQGMW